VKCPICTVKSENSGNPDRSDWRSIIVADCPAEIDACETCRVLDCGQGKWESCERRLQRMRELTGATAAAEKGVSQ